MDTSLVDLSSLKFIDLWEEYDNYMKINLKAQSYRKEHSSYINHIVPYFKNYLVVDINQKVYMNWLNFVEQQNYSYSFRKSLHGYMVSILNYAMKFYDLPKNVASLVGGFKRSKEDVKRVDFWTIEEYKKFIACVNDDLDNLLFNTLYFTGMRIGECLALTWNDYCNGCLDINKTISKEKSKSGGYMINSPKTKSSYRLISLDTDLKTKFDKMYKKKKKLKDFSNGWFIFGDAKPLSQTSLTRRKDKYCKLSDVKKIRLHDFRHSHATLLISLNVPIPTISKRLGHSDIAQTLNTYSHFTIQDEQKAIDSINNLKIINSL